MCSCISRYLFGITLAIMPGLAWSTVTVEFDQSSQTTSATVTQSQTTGRWTVTCNANYAQGPTTFWIKCDNNDDFDMILINANTTNQARVYIRTQRSTTTAGSIDLIARGSTGPVILNDLAAQGSVGDLVVNTVVRATINGDMTGSIVLPVHAAIGQSSLDNTHVLGSIFGDIDISAGTLLRLTVDGDIGTAQSPSTISVRDNLYAGMSSVIAWASRTR
ncbi:MAG: hypothetical protein IT434_15690 [Phycisphaerales bacterium]|jgi:hypothetical protein|nr:hypothetical protein [Phycisphaerales bacterium]